MCVPVDQRVNRRHVNGGSIEPATKSIRLSQTRPIQHDPTILLPDEVKDREVSQHAPEDQLAFRVKRNPNNESEQWDQRIKPGPALKFGSIKVDPEAGAP